SGVHVSLGHVDHSSGNRLAVDLGGHGDGVLTDAVEQVDSAVDRVDDPSHSGGAGGVALLLPQDRVAGAGRGDEFADQRLAATVDLGHHVDPAALGVGHGDALTGALADELCGTAGHLDGQV